MNKEKVLIKFAGLIIILIASNSTFAQKAGLERSKSLKIDKDDSVLLVTTWNSFLQNIETKNSIQIKKQSLQNVYCKSTGHVLPDLPKNKLMPIDSFVDSIMIKFYDKHFFEVIQDSAYRIMAVIYPDRRPSNFKLATGQKLILFDIYYIDYVPTGKAVRNQNFYIFSFVKIENQYKFFGVDLQSPY